MRAVISDTSLGRDGVQSGSIGVAEAPASDECPPPLASARAERGHDRHTVIPDPSRLGWSSVGDPWYVAEAPASDGCPPPLGSARAERGHDMHTVIPDSPHLRRRVQSGIHRAYRVHRIWMESRPRQVSLEEPGLIPRLLGFLMHCQVWQVDPGKEDTDHAHDDEHHTNGD